MRVERVFEVWHKVEPSFWDNGPEVLAAFPVGWAHVADVSTPDVGAVFQLTNHIDRNWTENREVTSRVGDRVRSTSVGDVIREATGPDGVPVWPGRRWTINGIGLGEF